MNPTVHGHRIVDRGTRRGARENILLAIEIFNGLSAGAGGVALMAHSDGAILHMPTTFLAGSPFSDYVVPGLALTLFVGVGMLGAALLLIQGRPYALELAIVSGAALVIFEIVEFSVIGFNPMQVLYGGLGAAVMGMAARRWLAETLPRRRAQR